MHRTILIFIVFAAGMLFGACEDGIDAKITNKLRSCDLLTSGKYNPPIDYTSENSCFVNCFLKASCDDVAALICEDRPTSAELVVCYEACETGQEFTCTDGSDTIPESYVCDCDEDCVDGSDELGCRASDCFECADGEWTFTADWVCDCDEDCSDGSDEQNCGSVCFECDDGSWTIAQEDICDCYEDCPDGSDEQNCGTACFECDDGLETVPQEDVCDADEDCDDGSDEPARCATYNCP